MDTGDEKDGETKADALSARQPAWLIGLMTGLIAASVVCLALGWQHRTPKFPLGEDFSSLSTVLWRTTFVVVGVLLLMTIYLVGGRVYRRDAGWRAKFVSLTTPALLIVVIATLIASSQGTLAKAFQAATEDQIAMRPFAVTAVAHGAWWFACLALATLAVLCALAYRTDVRGPAPRPLVVSRWVAAAVAVMVAVVCVLPVALFAEASPFDNETAEPIDTPTLTELTGEVAYRTKVNSPATYVRPGGAGWVQVANGPGHLQKTVEGYDGATGQRRWTFSMPRFSVSETRTTGIGPDSVVLVKSYSPADAMIALDATTGALLWTRVDHDTFDEHYPLASRVLLFETAQPDGATTWTALAARTGDQLWSKTFRDGCGQSIKATDSFVLVRTCEDGPDIIAHVLDAETGEEHGVITAASLGLGPGGTLSDSKFTLDAVSGDRVMISSDSATFVVDAADGQVVARVPDGFDAGFIDADSLTLMPSNKDPKVLQPISILDLRNDVTIETGLVSAWSAAQESWGPIARVGDQWLTLLPDDPVQGQNVSQPIRIIDTSGPAGTAPNPCEESSEAMPVVSRVPGAVLVVCGTVDVVAAVR